MKRLNPLLRFRSRGPEQHFVFRGNDGELFRIRGRNTFLRLRDAYHALSTDIAAVEDVATLGEKYGVPAELIDEVLLSDDFPPELYNEFDAPDFLPAIDGHMRLFFVFPSYECNLDCAYCTYSGLYPMERRHLPVQMARADIADALRLIRSAAREVSDAEVVFYGDEPLTNLPAVRALMDGLRDARHTRTRFHFQVVTNGLLLSEPVARNFIDRGVKLQLSLDGPPDTHDRYRKTRGGRASHARVMAKLAMLKELDADYVAAKVGIGCTLAPPFEPPHSLGAVARTNREQPRLQGFSGYRGNFSVSVMNRTEAAGGAPHPAYGASDLASLRAQMRDLYKRFGDAVLSGDEHDTRFLPAALFFAPFRRFAERCSESPAHWRRWRHTGECLPGAGGVAIGAEGRLYVCNSLNLHPIGDLKRGLSEDVLREQRGRYLEVRNGPCRSCWINRFCPLCPAAFKYAEDSFIDAMDCSSVRRQYDDFLDLYIRLTTAAPRSLRRFLDRDE